MNETYKELMRPFPMNRIKWRVGATTKDKNKGIALAYIDSRDVMNRLDDVVGFENWQCKYPHRGICELSIKINDEWITKSNCAGETQVEGEKGEASDAFKRAAVCFGVGRYLYYMKNVWVPIKPVGKSYAIASPPISDLKQLESDWVKHKLGE